MFYAWDDRNLDNALQIEQEFTRVYKDYKDRPRPIREAACLQVQLPGMMQPIEDGDWFFGRKKYRPLGVSPSYWNDETDGLDHITYYADLDRLERVKSRENQPAENVEAIQDLIDYWSVENANATIRSRFDETMQRELPSDLWTQESGAIFGLYRYAGAQLDYDKLVRLGIPGFRAEIKQRLAQGVDAEGQAFLDGLAMMLDTLDDLLERFGEMAQPLQPSPQKHLMIQASHDLRKHAPSSYYQALQLIWLYSAFSGTLDYGRLDVALGDWFCHDLDHGILSEQQAMEMTLSAYRLMQQVHGRDTRVILGGVGRRNPENADRFAIFAMEAAGRHMEAQPQLSLRMHQGMNPDVRQAAMDLLAKGLTYPLLYNDEASMEAVMQSMHVTEEEAEQYAFFGCGEYVIAHKSMGTPNDIINLLKVLEVTLNNGVDPVSGRPHGLALGAFSDFHTFDELLAAYKKQTEYFAAISARHHALVYEVANEKASMLMMSLLTDDCIERARAVADGGIRYLAGTYETYGNISTADSLEAIRRSVYEEKRFTQDELLEMLSKNFVGYEEERDYLLSLPKFGNNIPEIDELASDINEHVCRFVSAQAEINNLASYLVVMINNSANVVLGKYTSASADGRLAGTYMSNGNNPMAGMDQNGLTAMLHSIASTDMSITAGTAQNIKLSKALFTKQREILDALIDSIFAMDVLSLSVTVTDKEDLEQALIYPELYSNLFVRVGGFSARFTRLSKETQRDIINRTLY